jgi:hypothetical protein
MPLFYMSHNYKQSKLKVWAGVGGGGAHRGRQNETFQKNFACSKHSEQVPSGWVVLVVRVEREASPLFLNTVDE